MEEVKNMIHEEPADFEDQLADWGKQGLLIIERVSRYIREDNFTTSKQAYQIGQWLGRLESWHNDIDSIAERLTELIAEFNAS